MRVLSSASELAGHFGSSLVPTMGALHEGHASLIRRARAEADAVASTSVRNAPGALPQDGAQVLVTIFVNPTQFGPNEDFARYPRTIDADVEVAREAGADAVFVPSLETIYPRGVEAAQREAASWPLPPVAIEPRLEDRIRPGHFGGVCLVVARLIEICRPRRAYFGEKDWQQLRVISQMVASARTACSHGALALEIVPCRTVREPDGLALSSRNHYLDAESRHRATAIWRAIGVARTAPHTSAAEIDTAERAMRSVLEADGFVVDYAVIRNAATLVSPRPSDTVASMRVLVAARLGGVRLIDNAPLVADETRSTTRAA